MTHSTAEIEQIIKLHFNDPTANLMIEGDPGCGKTSIPKQIAAAYGIPFYYWNAPITEATEIGGIPYVDADNNMQYALQTNFPTSGPAIILIDEITKADRITMNCLSEICQERTLRGRKLSDQCLIIATGNPRSNRAGDNEMPTHMRDRFTFYKMVADAKAWLGYAIANGFDPIVRAFIDRFSEQGYLSKFDPSQQSSPSPRGWERVSKLMSAFNTPATEHLIFSMVSGTVGEGMAHEFEAFRRLASKLPSTASIFADPMNADTFAMEKSIQYLLITQLATDVTKKTANAFFTYISRLDADMAVVGVYAIHTRDASLMECSEGVMWSARNTKFMI